MYTAIARIHWMEGGGEGGGTLEVFRTWRARLDS